MRTPDDSTAPSRPVALMRELIPPWEYRHLRTMAALRLAGGGFSLGVGLVLVSLGRQAGTPAERRKCYGFAAAFLAGAASSLAGGLLENAVADAAPEPRPEA